MDASTANAGGITGIQRTAIPPPTGTSITTSALKQAMQPITTELNGNPDMHRQ